MRVTTALIVAAGVIAPSFLVRGDNPLAEVSAQELADALSGSRDKLRANAQVEFDVLRWHFEGGTEPQGVAEILALAEKSKLQPVRASAEDAKAAAESYKRAAIELLGQTDVQPWIATFLDGSIKFEEEVDLDRLQQFRGLAQAQDAAPQFDSRRQWLFTGQNVYAYGDGANAVTVSPLEPTTTTYPVSLDVLNPAFALRPGAASAWEGASIKEVAGSPGTYEFSFSKTTANTMLVSKSGENVGMRMLTVQTPGGYGIQRFYTDLVEDVLSPVLVPFAVTSIARSKGSTEIQLFVVRNIEIGKVTEGAMVLNVQKSARIPQEAVAGPVKVGD